MESKAFKSLQEAAIQVQMNEGAPIEYDEVEPMVLEYFENYFGDNLNEDISDEDIMNAVYDLINLTEAVCEAATFIPNDPEVDRYWGGKKKADELRRRLGQTVSGDDKNIPKVEVKKKKKRRKGKQLELFAANQQEAFGNLRKSPYAPKTGWTSSNTNRSLNQDIKSTRAHIGRVNRDDKGARKKMDSLGVSPNAPIRGDIQRKSSEKLNTLHGKLNKLRQQAN
tara:strand:- start:641 stop:1312 length:672 start_codon:yes stop_codon:yes gene_type:complete